MQRDVNLDARPAAIVRSLLEFMDARGVPPSKMLLDTRISFYDLRAHGVVSRTDLAQLVERAVTFGRAESLGLHWSASGRPFGHATLLYAVSESERTREDHPSKGWVPWRGTPHATWLRSSEGNLVLRVAAADTSERAYRVYVEATFAMFLRLFQGSSVSGVVPRSVSFSYSPPQSLAEYDAVFGCPQVFNAAASELVVHAARTGSAGHFLAPIPGLVSQTKGGLRRADGTLSSWSELVAAKFVPLGPAQPRGIGGVALSLGISVRTLRRKLAHEGTCFSQLARGATDNTRRTG